MPNAVTASSRTDGEDEGAGTGLSLVIDGVRHLQITTRLVPALKLPAHALVYRLCSSPARRLARSIFIGSAPTLRSANRQCLGEGPEPDVATGAEQRPDALGHELPGAAGEVLTDMEAAPAARFRGSADGAPAALGGQEHVKL